MKRKMRTFNEYLVEELRDPENAKDFLEVILDEYKKSDELEILLHSMQSIAKAKGGSLQLHDGVKADKEALNKLLMDDSSPTWEEVLQALGYLHFWVNLDPVPVY